MIRTYIQHHPSREALLPELKEQLLPFVAEVVTDDGPSPPHPWRGYKLCLDAFLESGDSHGVILQDDVRLCQNFSLAVEKVVEANWNFPVCLFLGGVPRKTATNALRVKKNGGNYVDIHFRDFCPVVGMIWPREKAQQLKEWTTDNPFLPGQPDPRSDDAVVGYWMLKTKQRIIATVPSLVEHPDLESIIHPKRAKSGKDRGRVALMFCEGDPLEIDWSS